MLKTLHLFKGVLLCFIIGTSAMLVAQDIHYSQFNRSPIYINPALAGIFKGDVRFVGNYRSQWNKVPVNYKTFSGSVEKKFINTNHKNSLFSAGLLFNYDEAGDLELSNTNIGLVGSYTHRLAEKHFVTGGLHVNLGQRRLSLDQLQVDQQYNGDTFDPSLSSGEIGLNTSVSFGDFSGGINYRFQNPYKRARLDIGGSIYHINQPNTSLYDGSEVQLSRRYNFYGITSFKIAEDFDLGLRAIGQFQGPHQEIVVGGTLKYHLEKGRSREVAVGLAIAYRLDDAWVPTIIVDYHNWSFGFNYDINTSNFNVATIRKGGPELSLIYIFSKVRPPKEFEICPIF